MTELTTAIIGGLVVTTAGGLGTIAVKRPKGFARLYWAIAIPIQIVNLLLLGFTIGARFAFANTKNQSQTSAAMAYVYSADQAMFWMFVVTLLLMVLLFLPNVLGDE